METASGHQQSVSQAPPKKSRKRMGKSKQRLALVKQVGLPKDKKSLQTARLPSLEEYERHRNRFGVPPYNHLENKRMLEIASLIRQNRGKKMPGDIPFNWATLFEGTQAPSIRCYYTHDDINTTSGTNVTDVFPVQGSSFLNWSDLAGAFQEYRFIGGEMWIVSATDCNTPTGATAAKYLGTGVGVIDYDNSNALATFNDGVQFDTKKFINLFHQSTKPLAHVVALPVWVEPLPDQDWISVTGGGAEDVAWLKLYVEGAHIVPTANEVAFVTGWMDIQWRGTGTG